jgi:hypothetical protein
MKILAEIDCFSEIKRAHACASVYTYVDPTTNRFSVLMSDLHLFYAARPESHSHNFDAKT